MTNTGIRSEPTEKSYNKVENMWSDFSDETGSFPKLKKMERSDIENVTGTYLVTSLNAFSSWMLSQSKIFLDGQKKIAWGP